MSFLLNKNFSDKKGLEENEISDFVSFLKTNAGRDNNKGVALQ